VDDLVGSERGPLLREHDELRAVACGGTRQPVGRLEVAVDVGAGIELHSGCAHGLNVYRRPP
jgi:hypothetical protein